MAIKIHESAPWSSLFYGCLCATLATFVDEVHAAAGPLPNPVPASCSAQVPESGSNSLMVSNDGSYDCAFEDSHSQASLGGWGTSSWTSTAPAGYWNLANCDGQTGDVDISVASAFTDLGGSITWTASNSSLYTQHWGAAIIWQTQANGGVAGSQFTTGCGGANGTMGANFYWISTSTIASSASTVNLGASATLTVTVNSPDGLGAPTGSIIFYRQAASVPDPQTDWALGSVPMVPNGAYSSAASLATNFSGKNPTTGQTSAPTPGTSYIYGVFAGSNFASAPTTINTGWTPTQTASISISLVTSGAATATSAPVSSTTLDTGLGISKAIRATDPEKNRPPVFSGNPDQRPTPVNTPYLDLKKPLESYCPKGSMPVQISIDSQTLGLDRYMKIVNKKGNVGIRIDPPDSIKASRLRTQLLCQKTRQPVVMNGQLGYGTPEGDVMATQAASLPSTLFGGLGNDRLTAQYPKDTIYGGPGRDTLFLSGAQSVGSGDLGNDRLEDIGPGPATLIGGPGQDQLIGGYGATRINALDGMGGDTITCKSSQNQVLADRGDIIKGPCTLVQSSP